MVKELPIYKIKGRYYWLDRRLGEYRSIKQPLRIIKFNDFPKLEKPNKNIWKKVKGKYELNLRAIK